MCMLTILPMPEGAAASVMAEEAAIALLGEAASGIAEDMAISGIIELLMPDPPPLPYCATAPPARSREDTRGSVKYIVEVGIIPIN